MNKAELSCSGLSVEYGNGIQAVRNVSFSVNPGECVALVGESGCGKTTISYASLGLLPSSAKVTGSIRVGDTEINTASPAMLRRLRGRCIGFVVQDPFEACNPLDRVERHVAEAWSAHGEKPPRNQILNSLARLAIRDTKAMMRRFPHQWSGGMLQRATIAAAAAHKPPLIIADEPTSALDVDLADETLAALRHAGTAILLISHDIDMVARHADRVAVVYAGHIVEMADARMLLKHPRHPYTIALLNAVPRPGAGLPQPLRGTPPDLAAKGRGCAFAPRCSYTEPGCFLSVPELQLGVACSVLAPHGYSKEYYSSSTFNTVKPDESSVSSHPRRTAEQTTAINRCSTPVAEAREVVKIYDNGAKPVTAVLRASLQVHQGEIIGICGPSGCGKSTFLRILATIEPPGGGEVYLNGQRIDNAGNKRTIRKLLRSGYVMPIFQDPVGSLDQHWPVWRTVTEPLMARQFLMQGIRREIAAERLHEVGLGHIDPDARPEELSVGQCQRISIVRAMITKPALIVADEPTSALDASVSAVILHLLAGVAAKGTAIVIASHDTAVLGALCHRIVTMRDGVL